MPKAGTFRGSSSGFCQSLSQSPGQSEHIIAASVQLNLAADPVKCYSRAQLGYAAQQFLQVHLAAYYEGLLEAIPGQANEGSTQKARDEAQEDPVLRALEV